MQNRASPNGPSRTTPGVLESPRRKRSTHSPHPRSHPALAGSPDGGNADENQVSTPVGGANEISRAGRIGWPWFFLLFSAPR